MSRTMLVTLSDLASVAGGEALMCGLDDGGRGLLRLDGAPRDPHSLAEARAHDAGLPVATVAKSDIRDMIHGIPVETYGSAGTLWVRVMTADELLAAHERACREFGMEPNLTRGKAEELTRTLG